MGKVGSVIGSSRNGKDYVKGLHKKRTKKVSKTELANRSKFTIAQNWLSPVLDYVRQGFKGYSAYSYGFIAAKSHLLLNAVEGVKPNFTINPALVKVSFGTLPLSNNIAVEKVKPKTLKFTWNKDWDSGGSDYDQVTLLAYDIENENSYYSLMGEFRKTGSDVLKLGSGKGRTYHIYLTFIADDRSRQSDSVYLGTITT